MSNACTLSASAKLNLHLEILGDRPDGFHELATIFQSVDLADRVTVRSTAAGVFSVSCDRAEVPQDASNLAYRAADLMARRFPEVFAKCGGAAIAIEKHIPVAAGLAGGSANAAAALVGLDLLWGLGLTRDELQTLGAELGSDVPFCIGGGTVLAVGRGERLDSLADVPGLVAVLGKYRSLSIATAWAYTAYREQFADEYARTPDALEERRHRVRSGAIVRALNRLAGGDRDAAAEVGALLHNDLERVVLPAYPAIAKLRQVFEEAGCLGALLSGSGPTTFALTDSVEAAENLRSRVAAALPDPDLELWVAPLSSHGVRLTG